MMEIRITSRQTQIILTVVSWIIFVGVSIDAGGILFNSIYAPFFNPAAAKTMWIGADLSALLAHDRGWFLVITGLMSLVGILKATIFYRIVMLLQEGKLNMAQPFSREVGRFIFLLSYLTLFIGFFCSMGTKYCRWMTENGVAMPPTQDLRLGAADVWYFMGVTLFVVAHIFKRGIVLQQENDLTI